jgi:hypothetical protein
LLAFFITTNNVSTLENTSKVITLAVNAGSATFDITGGDADKYLVCVFGRRKSISRGNMKFPVVIRIVGDGYNEGLFICREEGEVEIKHLGGFDINTISGIISAFKSRGFES